VPPQKHDFLHLLLFWTQSLAELFKIVCYINLSPLSSSFWYDHYIALLLV